MFSSIEVFSRQLHADSHLTTVELGVYTSLCHSFHRFGAEKIDHRIFLEVPVEVCHDRMLRRAREEEKLIPIEYLRRLEEHHRVWKEKLDPKDYSVISMHQWERESVEGYNSVLEKVVAITLET